MSKNEWHKCSHLLLISGIGVGKMPEQEPFFLPDLDPKTDDHERDSQKATQTADFDGRADTAPTARVRGPA